MAFKATDYLITPKDIWGLGNYLLDLTGKQWLYLCLIGAIVFFAHHYDVGATNLVFLGILLWVFLFDVDARVPLKGALVSLLLIIVLVIAGKYSPYIDGDAWSEQVAVWVYFFLSIGVIKQVKDHFVETDTQGEILFADQVETDAEPQTKTKTEVPSPVMYVLGPALRKTKGKEKMVVDLSERHPNKLWVPGKTQQAKQTRKDAKSKIGIDQTERLSEDVRKLVSDGSKVIYAQPVPTHSRHSEEEGVFRESRPTESEKRALNAPYVRYDVSEELYPSTHRMRSFSDEEVGTEMSIMDEPPIPAKPKVVASVPEESYQEQQLGKSQALFAPLAPMIEDKEQEPEQAKNIERATRQKLKISESKKYEIIKVGNKMIVKKRGEIAPKRRTNTRNSNGNI
jgi:hypothetical protein